MGGVADVAAGGTTADSGTAVENVIEVLLGSSTGPDATPDATLTWPNNGSTTPTYLNSFANVR